ncbi:tryptophan--tRNA ligase [Patescibacteria group bacterium]|nr:MAG: tryptophan--tRNA ligase [Patescibacteria group bacterium]
MSVMSKPVILTGIRANNDLTIGNYFGAILPIIDMAKTHSDEYQVNLFIPDLHSFTTPIDHSLLYDQILHNARLFVAAGLPLDNPDIYLYRQSYISAHSELTWILDCFTGFGEMSRMVEFKDKMAKIGDDRVSVGLFNYPVLMAADILLYNAGYVPVGDDQRQHLEYARDVSERFNNQLGDTFTVPEPVKAQHELFGKDQGLRIKDLIDPTKKMSKSDDSGRGVIFLGDEPAAAAKKVMGATTDDLASIHFDLQSQPGISNLLQILSLLQGRTLEEVSGEFEGQTSYGDFKSVVASEVEKFLTDFQARLATVDDAAVIAKLEQSERDLIPVANATLLRAQQAVGLRQKG